MNCERLETLLLDLLYEELEETSAREARAHAHGCASCGRKLESFRQVRRVALSLPEPAPPALPYTALLAEAQNAARQWKGEKEGEKESVPQKPAKRRKDEENTSSWWDSFSQKLRFLLSPPFAAAAALTLLLASSFYLINKSSQEAQPGAPAAVAPEAPLMAAEPAPAPTLGTGRTVLAQQEKGAIDTSTEELFMQGSAPPSLDSLGGVPARPMIEGDSVYVSFFTEADLAFREGRYQDALASYRAAVEASEVGSEDWTRATSGLAQSQAYLQNCGEAEATARNLIAGSEPWSEAMFAVADCYVKTKDQRQASALYSELVKYPASADEANRRLASFDKPKLANKKTSTAAKTAKKDVTTSKAKAESTKAAAPAKVFEDK